MTTTETQDQTQISGVLRALSREYDAALLRLWITALLLAALAAAVLPWQGWCIPAAWLALVAWMTAGATE